MKAPTPTPSPPPHPLPTQKRTHATIATHTHLGLRPKSPDSLHARIRSSHPQPKHVSRIEDVVGSGSEAHSHPSRTGSNGSAYEGAISTGVDTTSISGRLRKPNGFLSREGSESHLGTGSGYPSRSASPLGSHAGSSSDLGHYSTENSARSSVVGLDDDGDVYEIAYDDDNDDIETTDIGIYRDEVYDQYLGPVMGAVRRLLVQSLRWESPILARHQRAVRTRRLDRYFVYTSLMGSHSFFLIFLPTTYWLVNDCFARGLVMVLAAGVYFSSAIKDALCIPRPYSPPVTRLVIGTTHLEYGFLSTHSTNCISIVLYVYLWLQVIRDKIDVNSTLQSGAWEAGLIFYAISVVYGRIYCGMHSIMDCVTGCALGAAITMAQWHVTPALERILSVQSVAVPAVINVMGIVMVMVHPQPLDDCPCFEDAIAFLSVVMGILTGRWWTVRYGFAPLQEFTLSGIPASVSTSQVPEDYISSLLRSLAGSPILWYALSALRFAAVLVLGVGSIFAARVIVKTVCRVILPPIFRFAGSLGVILPRRHYTSSTDYAAMQAQQHADEKTASGKNIDSTSKVQHTETKRDHRRNASWIPRSPHEDIDSGFAWTGSRSRSQSLQGANLGTESNQVKFTLGDGKDLQVPFTHPNTHLIGDGISERIAGALSAEERARQQYEGTAGGGEGLHRRTPSLHRRQSREGKTLATATNKTQQSDDALLSPAATAKEADATAKPVDNDDDNEEIQVRHYDVDVLTKVFVYHAIGFVASAGVPVTFRHIGLLPP